MSERIMHSSINDRIVLHIPHNSPRIPEEYRHHFVLNDDELDKELLKVTDHYTEQLFSGLFKDCNKVVANVSRLLVDVERFADDTQEPMASKGVGCVYQLTSNGKSLRIQIGDTERQNLLNSYYYPHHNSLSEKVTKSMKASGKCLIIDCHSFPSVPLSYDLDQSVPRTDFCLGTDSYHTPEPLVREAKAYFEQHGLVVAIDSPYSGTMVPLQFYQSNTSEVA